MGNNAVAMLGVMTTTLIFVLFGALVTRGFAYMGMFSKFGEQRWKAFIPFYSDWIFLEKIGLSGWYMLCFFIPYLGYVIWLLVVAIYLYVVFTDSQGNKFNLLGYILGFLFLGGLIPYLNYSYGDKWIYNRNVITNE